MATAAAAATTSESAEQKAQRERYAGEMRGLAFELVASLPGHFKLGARGGGARALMAGSGAPTREFLRRVSSELSDLSEALPISLESAVFFRAMEDCMSVCQMLIIAPTDTPYAGGCFLFDLFLPPEYPQRPPLVQIRTTGNGSVRFNPNLYADGKVCLSLLGTWHGDAAESWNAHSSTLLQLAISIQSLIFVPEPYFNEPGFMGAYGTPAGMRASDEYNREVEANTIRWAMLDMLRAPPPAFAEAVKRHFRLRGPAILAQCRRWAAKPNRALGDLVAKLDKAIAQLAE
jgi:baculoviral IAP repeat-containing protein 6